ncbi:MAG: Nif3-like dinuclear metal center hexameric protein [Planctomycetes bacterium]|nr:Nif3-like dinuclear metal center hexameric protein [Planctomycetota bacterium]
MLTVDHVVRFLEAFAPVKLAESWDNVGLLVGDRAAAVERAMTCLTITPSSAAEAVAAGAQLIVTHHPLPFKPLKQLTTDTSEGRLLWQLARAGVSIYSPHTAFDSAAQGINQHLAEGLGLTDIEPLVLHDEADPIPVGAGRFGKLQPALTLAELAARVKKFFQLDLVQRVGPGDAPLTQVAVACGSAGEFLATAERRGCQCLLTGETRFHTCLEAEARGMTLLLAGHFATERFAVERLAAVLAEEFAELSVWASRDERDPLNWA